MLQRCIRSVQKVRFNTIHLSTTHQIHLMSTNTNKDNDNTKKQQQDEEKEEVATNLPKGMTKTVAILTGSQFINNLGFGCVIPVLPLFASDMGLGASGVGMIL